MSNDKPYIKPNDYQVAGTHYQHGVQPWEVIDTWPLEQQYGYHRGNILKYIMRMGNKAGNSKAQEAEKVRHYAEKLIEVCHKMDNEDW